MCCFEYEEKARREIVGELFADDVAWCSAAWHGVAWHKVTKTHEDAGQMRGVRRTLSEVRSALPKADKSILLGKRSIVGNPTPDRSRVEVDDGVGYQTNRGSSRSSSGRPNVC